MFYLLVYQHLILYHFSFVINHQVIIKHSHSQHMDAARNVFDFTKTLFISRFKPLQHLNNLSKTFRTMSRFQKATAHHQGENFDI